jgi:ribonuclease-3
VSEAGAEASAADVEAALGYAFRDRTLLETALTHASFAHEQATCRSNERLEFLGDAVLGLVTAELLYSAHPEWSEGELTRARAALVNQRSLADCAREMGLGSFVKLGRTEERSAGECKDSILADCFEAMLGAVYLDGGPAAGQELIERAFGDAIERGAVRDPKTAFQEWAHVRFQRTPSYRTTGDSGTENDDQRFTVQVCIGDEVWGTGSGRSKRVAERSAAEAALERSGVANA